MFANGGLVEAKWMSRSEPACRRLLLLLVGYNVYALGLSVSLWCGWKMTRTLSSESALGSVCSKCFWLVLEFDVQ